MNRKISSTTLGVISVIAFNSVALGMNAEGVHWGYEGHEGPSNWAELSEDYALCSAGKTQSPIDISWGHSNSGSPLITNYDSTQSEILNNGHTIQVNLGEGNTFKTEGRLYNLLQFHFHTPSENTVDGEHYPMEMHLVHADNDGNLAVLAVMFKSGKKNQELANIWSQMPIESGASSLLNRTVDPNNLLPTDFSASLFQGSLTTPPCSEGVAWNVLRNPVEASLEQITKFEGIVDKNARPVQPINNRLIKHFN